MLVPYRPKSLPKSSRRYKYIIIHDLTCMFDGVDQAKIDEKKSQVGVLRSHNWIVNGQSDLNYHYVVETLRRDHETILGRPLNKWCEYDDIFPEYNASIHIGMVGKYSIMKPDMRYYQQIAYRVIAPAMALFRIPLANIKLHSHVSRDEHKACPGNFFDYNMLMAQMRPMLGK